MIVYSRNNTSFWHDRWISVIPLRIDFKELYEICNFKNALILDVFSSENDPSWNFSFNKILEAMALRQLSLFYARLNLYNIDNKNDNIK